MLSVPVKRKGVTMKWWQSPEITKVVLFQSYLAIEDEYTKLVNVMSEEQLNQNTAETLRAIAHEP